MPDEVHHDTGTRTDETRGGLEPEVEGVLEDEDELDITQPRSVVRLPVTTTPLEPGDADAAATPAAPADPSQAEMAETPTADEAAAATPDGGDRHGAQTAAANDHADPTLDDGLSAAVDAGTDLAAAAEAPIEGPLDALSAADESESTPLAEELRDPARLREPEETEQAGGDGDGDAGDAGDAGDDGDGEEDAPAGAAKHDAGPASVAGGDEAGLSDSAAHDEGDERDILPAAVPVADADMPSERSSEQQASGTDSPPASPEMPAAAAYGQRAGPTLPLPSRRNDTTTMAFGARIAPAAEAIVPPALVPIVAVETQPEAPPPSANGTKPKPADAAEQAALAAPLPPPAGEATPAAAPPPPAVTVPAEPVGRAAPANMAPPPAISAPAPATPAQARRSVADVSGIHSQVPQDHWLDEDPLENMRRSLGLKGARPVTLEAGRPLPKPSRFRRAPRWLSFVVLLVVLAVIALCASGVVSLTSAYLRQQRNPRPVPAATSVPATTTPPATP